jgi:hypothetical protein
VYSTRRRASSLTKTRNLESISYSAISPEAHGLLDHPIAGQGYILAQSQSEISLAIRRGVSMNFVEATK